MKILINHGHAPGIDSGAVNFDYNLQECHVALEIGRKVADYLNETGVMKYGCISLITLKAKGTMTMKIAS